MAISEHDRRVMYDGLTQALGGEVADLLMDHLPPVGWADVATKRDLEHTTVMHRVDLDAAVAHLRADMVDFGGQLRTEMADLGGAPVADLAQPEMADLGGQLRTEMADLGGQLRTEMAGIRTEMADLRGDLTQEMARQTRTIMLGTLAAYASTVAAAGGIAGALAAFH